MTPVNFSTRMYFEAYSYSYSYSYLKNVDLVFVTGIYHQPLAMAQGWWVGILSPVRLSANRSGILDQRFSGIFIRLVDYPHVADRSERCRARY